MRLFAPLLISAVAGTMWTATMHIFCAACGAGVLGLPCVVWFVWVERPGSRLGLLRDRGQAWPLLLLPTGVTYVHPARLIPACAQLLQLTATHLYLLHCARPLQIRGRHAGVGSGAAAPDRLFPGGELGS